MTAFTFSEPQRQSKVGIIVMFAYTLQQYGRAIGPLLLIGLLKLQNHHRYFILIALAILLAIAIVVAYLKYRNFTFMLDSVRDEFIITEGILNKTRTSIQLNRIQQVNINQSFLQRLVNVYELSVDTAGSNDKEGSIRAVSHTVALALKARIIENIHEAQREDPRGAESVNRVESASPFIKISLGTLLKVGITSNYGRSISLLLLFFITIYEQFNNFTGGDLYEDQVANRYAQSNLSTGLEETSGVQIALIMILFVFVIVLAINLVRVVFKYFGYNISKQQGSLLLSYGLLSRKNTIVKPGKVQITTLTQNYLQRKMDILEIKIRQANAGGDEKENKKAAIDIPGCSSRESDKILKLIFNTIPASGNVLLPNYRKLVFSIFLSIIVPLCIYGLIGYYIDSRAFDYAYLVPVYVLLSGTVLYFGYRNYRLSVHDDFIIKRSGAWDVSTQIIEPSKIQAIATSQLFWHKKPDLGYVTLYTAGGNITFGVSNFSVIKTYVNHWLYGIETSDQNWM